MNWMENWPLGLMVASVLLFVGALLAIARFLRNASGREDTLDRPADEHLEETRRERRRSTEGFVSVALLAFVVVMTATHVAYQRVSMTPEEQKQLAVLTGAERESDAQLLFVARTGKRIDGYALLVSNERGPD